MPDTPAPATTPCAQGASMGADNPATSPQPRRWAPLIRLVHPLARALVAVSHHSLAAVGLGVAAALLLALSQPGLRSAVEAQVLGWLQIRQEARAEAQAGPGAQVSPGPEAAEELSEAMSRTTASAPSSLTAEQAAVAEWIAKRYRIAVEPVARLVLEAWSIGPRVGLEPALILAVAAVESSFNPFAQGTGGAKGLMQVVAHAHLDKFEPLGGLLAAFDPVSNLRVGALVLKESITEAGSVEAGLHAYMSASGAAELPGYTQRVLGEKSQLQKVAERVLAGQSTPAASAAPARAAQAPDLPATAGQGSAGASLLAQATLPKPLHRP